MIKIPHSRKYLEAMTENIRSYYMVTRPIYSENAFSSKHKKVIRYHKTLLDHLKECFRCPTGTVKRTIFNLIPIAAWLPMYNLKEWLLGDMISGISTGMVSVLQGLAFALLVNVSPVYGLYSAFYPTLIYIFLGTSKHISVGPFPVLSLMVGSAVMRLVPDPVDEDGTVNFNVLNNTDELTIAEQRVLVAASVTVLVGIFQLVFGLLHAGFIVIYLSDPLISGFTTAAAIHVLVSQLKFVLGLKILNFNGPLSLFFTLEDIFHKINNTNIADLATSIIIMVVVLIVKELNDRYQMKIPIPVELIMLLESSNAREYVYITTRQLPDASHYISSMRETILATGISYAFDFNRKFHVQIIGELESGYQPPITPSISVFEECMIEAFTIAIVAFAIGFSVARVYSIKHDYPINGNQELVAFGLGNIVCGFFKGFAVSTALSRSAVQESTGGKSQISGLISALIVMIVTLSIGFLLETLPKSVLGAICLINLKGMMMQFREVPVLWMKDKFDCSVWVVTFTAAVILGLDLGLAVGVGFELLTVVFRTQFPKCTLMARVGKSNIYRNRKDYLDIFEPEGMKIFRCPSPIFFANSGFFKDKLNSAVGFNPVRVLHKRNKALRKIRKLLNKGILQFSPKGVLCTSYEYMDSYDDLDNMKVEELNNPINTDDLPFTIDWKSELPHNIEVPKVELHTLILDFGAVSFIDVSGMKNLKTILKDYLTIEVDVYIASIDSTVLDKLNHCGFFDDSIQSVILFPTIHDAVLYALSKRGMDYSNDQKTFKDKGFGNYENGYMNGNIRNRDHSVLHETTF